METRWGCERHGSPDEAKGRGSRLRDGNPIAAFLPKCDTTWLKAEVPVCGMETQQIRFQQRTIYRAKGRGSRLRDGNDGCCPPGHTCRWRLKAEVPVCGMETHQGACPVLDAGQRL